MPACKRIVLETLPRPPARARIKAAHIEPVAPPPAAAAPPSAAVAAGPTPEQLEAVKFTCRRDFRLHCRGIPPGGPEALGCLERHAARLTPNCKTSIADIEATAPAAAAAMEATAPPAAATEAHHTLPPAVTPAGRVLRRVIRRAREREEEERQQ
jgi:hypothetical protein